MDKGLCLGRGLAQRRLHGEHVFSESLNLLYAWRNALFRYRHPHLFVGRAWICCGPQFLKKVLSPYIFESPGSSPVEYVRRSEEHTSELQSHLNLVCRLLLEKKTSFHKLKS